MNKFVHILLGVNIYEVALYSKLCEAIAIVHEEPVKKKNKIVEALPSLMLR